MTTQLAVRLPDDLLADLDWLMARCAYSTRTEAMRDAIVRVVEIERRRLVGEQIVEAYTRQPQTDDECAGTPSPTWLGLDDDDWSGLDAPR